MSLLYIVRHGECVANTQGLLAGGELDSPLTPTGEKQAEKVADALTQTLNGKTVDLVAASPLVRANRTATIITQKLDPGNTRDVPWLRTLPGLAERNVGRYSGLPKRGYYAFEEQEAELVAVNPREADALAAANGVETLHAFHERVHHAILQLHIWNPPVGLVVAHSGTIRMMHLIMRGLPLTEFFTVGHPSNGETFPLQLPQQ